MGDQPDRLNANTWHSFIEHVARNASRHGMGDRPHTVARTAIQRGTWVGDEEYAVLTNGAPFVTDRVAASSVITACPLTDLTADTVDPTEQRGVAVDLLAKSISEAVSNVSPDTDE